MTQEHRHKRSLQNIDEIGQIGKKKKKRIAKTYFLYFVTTQFFQQIQKRKYLFNVHFVMANGKRRVEKLEKALKQQSSFKMS